MKGMIFLHGLKIYDKRRPNRPNLDSTTRIEFLLPSTTFHCTGSHSKWDSQLVDSLAFSLNRTVGYTHERT